MPTVCQRAPLLNRQPSELASNRCTDRQTDRAQHNNSPANMLYYTCIAKNASICRQDWTTVIRMLCHVSDKILLVYKNKFILELQKLTEINDYLTEQCLRNFWQLALNGLGGSKFIVLKFTQTTSTKPYYKRKLPPFGNDGVRNSNLLISAVMLKDVLTQILL